MPQWRAEMVSKILNFWSWIQLKISRCEIEIKRPKSGEIDYSYYLGKDHQITYHSPRGKVSTYIAPHCSALDGPIIANATNGKVSFVAGDFIKGWPFFGFCAQAAKCIFVPRGGSPQALEKTLSLIGER